MAAFDIIDLFLVGCVNTGGGRFPSTCCLLGGIIHLFAESPSLICSPGITQLLF